MTSVGDRLGLDPAALHLLGAVVVFEVLVVGIYFAITPASALTFRYVVYPFLWIDVGLLALFWTDPVPAPRRDRALAGTLATGYFVLLAVATGLIGVSASIPLLSAGGVAGVLEVLPAHAGVHTEGLQVTMASPGWGPRIAYVTHVGYVYFIPYRVIGYLVLAYLLYAAVLDAVVHALPGVVGLASCVGCSFPLAAAAAGLGGSASVLASAATGLQPDISTAVFLVAVGLLSWRPDR